MSFAFQLVDLVVVLIVLVSAVYATYRGLVSESLAVFGWIAAAYGTLLLGPYCAGWMRSMVEPKWVAEVVGFIVVFLVILIPLHFASSRIAVNVKRSEVGTLDSVLGTGFGILRGGAIIGIAYLVFTAFVPIRQQPEWIVGARLMPVIRASAEVVASLIPDPDVRVEKQAGRGGAPKPYAPAAKPAALPQDQPFKKSVNKADDDGAVAQKPQKETAEPSKGHKEAVEPAKTHSAPEKEGKHAKKTYGAKDRHALDRLIETSHSDASGKP